MSVNWQIVYSNFFSLNVSPKPQIYLNNNLTGRHLLILCQSLGAPGTWQRAGYLQTFFDDSSIGSRAVIRSRRCKLGHTYLSLTDWEYLNSFQFQPVPWLLNIQIKVWSTADLDIYDPIRRIEERVNDMSDFK